MLGILFALGVTIQGGATQPATPPLTLEAGIETVSLGTASIGGRDVTIKVPTHSPWILPDAPHVPWKGWKYRVTPAGSVDARYEVDGGWGDVQAGWSRLTSQPASAQRPWKVKLFVFTRAEVMEKGSDGILRVRRQTLERVQIGSILDACGTLKAIAETESAGRLKLAFDVTIDDDPIRVTAEAGGTLVGADFVRHAVGPRINAAPFETDDPGDRGPFDSVFIVHPVLTRHAADSTVSDTPVTSIPFYTLGELERPFGLAVTLYEGWLRHLRFAADRLGYRVPAVPDSEVRSIELTTPSQGPVNHWPQTGSFMTPAIWGSVVAGRNPTDAEFVARRWPVQIAALRPWSEVTDDPWTRLPELQLQASEWPTGEPEAIGAVGARWFVPANLADFFAAHIESTATVQGYADREGHRYVLFQRDRSLKDGESIVDALTIDTKPNRPAVTVLPTAPVALESQPRAGGFFTVAKVNDPTKGVVTQVTEYGSYRRGWARIMGVDSGSPIVDLGTTPILQFSMKAIGNEGIGLVFDGLPRAVVLRPTLPNPVEVPVGTAPLALDIPFDGDWHSVVIDLRQLKGTSSTNLVRSVFVMPPANAAFYERQRFEPTVLTFADWNARAPIENEVVVETASLAYGPIESRAKRIAELGVSGPLTDADKTLLLEALTDAQELVRLNAVDVLNRLKVTEALPALVDQARSASPSVSERAIQALVFQDAPEGWAALLAMVTRGPFDYTRQFAARALGLTGDPKYAGPISTLMTTRSWRAREDSAKAIAKLPGDEAGVILIALLQEVDPSIRLAIVERANVSLELINRRLLWSSVNDPSESVRAAAAVRLIGSPLAEFQKEGYKAVRDESPWVRLAVLEALRSQPRESHRGALRLGVADPSAAIRAAALRGFAAMPGNVEAAEIENVLEDKDPRVQAALLDLVGSKKLKLPDAAWKALKTSLDPIVARRAAEVGG